MCGAYTAVTLKQVLSNICNQSYYPGQPGNAKYRKNTVKNKHTQNYLDI